jgi:hypothetical protein
MSKKINKEFKEKLLKNKVNANAKYEEKKEIAKSKSIVMVDIEEKNLIAKVDRGSLFVDGREVEELVRDIFYTNVELEENSIINLDEICDVCYRLNYRGIVNNEALFSLC